MPLRLPDFVTPLNGYDYIIPDSGYLSDNLKQEEDIFRYLSTLVKNIRAAAALPFLILTPSIRNKDGASKAEIVHINFCKNHSVPYINLSELFRIALQGQIKFTALMRDDWHISPYVTPFVGQLIGRCISHAIQAQAISKTISMDTMSVRRIAAATLVTPEQTVTRGSSLRKGSYAVLSAGDTLKLKLNEGEALQGLMLNTGAFGAKVSFEGAGSQIVKNFTIYWDWNEKSPDTYIAILAELLKPLQAKDGYITIKILTDENTPTTERTLNEKPTLPGRYGVIEVEGFLITSSEPVSSSQAFNVIDDSYIDMLKLFPANELISELTQYATSQVAG